jgi:hypothetical protein
MSGSPEPPERLAEILLESVSGSDPIELFDPHCVKEQSQRRDDEDDQPAKTVAQVLARACAGRVRKLLITCEECNGYS